RASTLCPYTTLFRSAGVAVFGVGDVTLLQLDAVGTKTIGQRGNRCQVGSSQPAGTIQRLAAERGIRTLLDVTAEHAQVQGFQLSSEEHTYELLSRDN